MSGNTIIEAEQTVLGILLASPSQLMVSKLCSKHFAVEMNKLVFDSIVELEKENQAIDVFSVNEVFKNKTGRDFLPQLLSMANNFFTVGVFGSAQNIVLENYRKSEIRKITTQLNADFDTDRAIQSLMDLGVIDKNYTHTLADASALAVKQAMEKVNEDGLTGLTTGLTALDDSFGGLQSPDLYVIGARPAMGKTSFIINMMLANDAPVAFFSTEQPMIQVGLRSVSIESGVEAVKIRKADFNDDDAGAMSRALTTLSHKNVYIHDNGLLTITELMREARRLKYSHDVKAIYVDYIQRIKSPSANDRRNEVAEVVTGLKTLARELEIPVIGLAQVNRAVEQRVDKRARMGDLLESGVIEQEADVVMLLYRDEVYNPDSNKKGLIEVLVDKNRHGGTGIMMFEWQAKTMTVRDIRH